MLRIHENAEAIIPQSVNQLRERTQAIIPQFTNQCNIRAVWPEYISQQFLSFTVGTNSTCQAENFANLLAEFLEQESFPVARIFIRRNEIFGIPLDQFWVKITFQ